jgi:uncharacterized protein YdeI (YjbR/CyaY-like superfamily)
MENITALASYFNTETRFQKALNHLREILLSTELVEEYKWDMPVYTLNGENLIGLCVFKDHFAVLFFNGDFLVDKNNLLINAHEGKTKHMRQLRYSTFEEIDENTLKTYIQEAITNQNAGLDTQNSLANKTPAIPKELENAFALSSHLKTRFALLPEEKQREYIHYISEGEDEQARSKRLEHCIPFIMLLRGIADLQDKK